MLGGEHSEDLQALDPGTRQQQTNIVVDREFVATFGLGTPEHAIGKLVYQLPNSFNNEKQAYTKQIVGVVENRVFSLFGVPNANAVVYTLGNDFEYTIARIDRREVAGAIATIDARWKALAPNVPIGRRFVDDAFNQAFETWLRINRLFGLLAVFAFVISVAGLFGMATLTAARRRQEVGLRKSVGASTWQMVLLLLASFSRPVVVANLAVWPLAFVGVRTYLKQFLTPISITPWPFVASLFLTLAIAWLAVCAQTLRVARLAPAEVLRHE
jgi:putative ABC transport system permease protein